MKTNKHNQSKLYLRKNQFLIFFLSLVISAIFSFQANACSTFLLSNDNTFIYGRNFDYPYGKYIIMTNMRGAEKVCWQYSSENVDMPLTWTAKYGSITFNMFGQDTPPDGINEAGLVVSSLILTQSVYPNIVGEQSLSLDQLLQYLLDNCATVNEVIDECSNLNIRLNPFDYWRLHFFVVDKNGQAAVIEFLDGELVATTGADLEKKVITNSSYEESIDYYHTGKNPDLPETASLNRYYNAVEMIDAYNNQNLIDYAYSIMDFIAQRITMRRVVYDIPNRRVYFKSNTNEKLRYFDLSSFDLSCSEHGLSLHRKS
jgi:penicillin V acylase-like amidase (Ntn superfamily)